MPSQPFPPDPQSVRRVRQMIRREIPWADTWDIELVASELVTNVIRHANTDLVVSLEIDEDKVRIEVVDGSAIMPAARDLIDGTGGAGLRLVEAISERWGADQRPEGKVVWAEIRIGQKSTEEPRRS
ncbi:MAG TPA: ATP-binding protein [Acidimicrobiia bacterium]|nr:ATP-binding protein [Acidimicrobiia bacterium]